MKRVLVVAVLGLLLAAAAFAAGSVEQAAPQTVTLKYLIPEHPNTPLTGFEEGKYSQLTELMKRTGVNISFIPVNSENYAEKYNLVIAGGDLPDLMANMNLMDDKQYGMEGTFIRLNDLIRTKAPNIDALFQKIPAIPAKIMAENGDIYSIPSYGEGPLVADDVLLYRRDITAKNGWKEPETMEQWYTLLKNVKAKYPEMIPMVRRGNIVRKKSICAIWGIFDGTKTIRNDRYVLSPFVPEFKQMLAYLNRLYTEGLLDKEYLVTNTKQWEDKILNEIGFMTPDNYSRSAFFTDAGSQTNPAFDFVGAAPTINYMGERKVWGFSNIWEHSSASITRACKYPDAAMKLFDYCFSPQGKMLISYGIQGKTYDLVNGKVKYKPEIAAAQLSGLVTTEREYGIGKLYGMAGIVIGDMDETTNKQLRETVEKSEPFSVEVPYLTYRMAQLDRVKSLEATIVPLVDTEGNKFIMGVRPLSEYDKFLEELKKAGAVELEQIYNDAYDRYKAALQKK
jgi:putative aldouronate transport system substrate-binding protein